MAAGTQGQFGDGCLNKNAKYLSPLLDFSFFFDMRWLTNGPGLRIKCFRKLAIVFEQCFESRTLLLKDENLLGVLQTRSYHRYNYRYRQHISRIEVGEVVVDLIAGIIH